MTSSNPCHLSRQRNGVFDRTNGLQASVSIVSSLVDRSDPLGNFLFILDYGVDFVCSVISAFLIDVVPRRCDHLT